MLYRSLLRPLLFRLPPEKAHELALQSLRRAFQLKFLKQLAAKKLQRGPFGPLQRFGLTFPNPVGLAAGFDKNALALPELVALGFGFIEAGTVTFHPQPGNPRPRIFRLAEDKALINRAGFNNDGAAALVARVQESRPDCIIGISIGKSRITPLDEAVEDYLKSFELVRPVADYVAINVSSPNTPGLRTLQQSDQLENLVTALQSKNLNHSVPLLVKVSPDLAQEELGMIVDVVRRTGVAGIIATNTTIDRSGLRTSVSKIREVGEGGLSGAPLKNRSNQIIAALYCLTGGSIPIIGVGGIFNAEDAWEKISAGASLIQLYTGFIYEGPAIAKRINEGLECILIKERFQSLDAAVGSRAKELATTS